MTAMLQESRRTTKKAHRCFGCYRRFPAKTAMVYNAQVFDGDFHGNYFCLTCWHIWSKEIDWSEHDEGKGPGELRERCLELEADLYVI